MKLHLLARYYNWASAPERWLWARLWIGLPMITVLPLAILAQWIVDSVPITDPVLRNSFFLGALAPSLMWLGYVGWRLLKDAVHALRWFARATWPSWRSGWRAAWQTVRGGIRR